LGWHCDWVVIGFATFAYHNPHARGGIFFEKSISLGNNNIFSDGWLKRDKIGPDSLHSDLVRYM
jgi:hypothetical protein